MSEIQHFSQQDIEILGEQTLYEGFFTLKRIQFKHKLFAGGAKWRRNARITD